VLTDNTLLCTVSPSLFKGADEVAHEMATALLATLALVSPALAIDRQAHFTNPPARYDHPYRGKLIVKIVAIEKLHGQSLCRKSSIVSHACAAMWDAPENQCIIWLPKVDGKVVTAEYQARALRHEIGHCNGWPANHPL